jgi:hypothetical protein
MELNIALKVLQEQYNMEVALNMGEHAYCSVESNCPVAVKLRKILIEAGIDFDELKTKIPEQVNDISIIDRAGVNLDDVTDTVTATVFGTEITIPVQNIIKPEFVSTVQNYIYNLKQKRIRLDSYAYALQDTFNNELAKARRKVVLPTLEIPFHEAAGVTILANNREEVYEIYVPTVYAPKLIYDDGVNYQLDEADRVKIERKNLYMRYRIRPDKVIVDTILVTDKGEGLEHYHGRSGHDCWGTVETMSKWDGSIKQLRQRTLLLERSLVTINYNSLLRRDPSGMPGADSVMSRATAHKLGVVGEIEQRKEALVQEINTTSPVTHTVLPTETTVATGARGWGLVRR